MRLANSAHTSRPWRIHELAPDFRLEDVWELPWRGGPEDFPRAVQLIVSGDPSHSLPGPARALVAIRSKLGELLGWDDPDTGLGARVPTLRDRLHNAHGKVMDESIAYFAGTFQQRTRSAVQMQRVLQMHFGIPIASVPVRTALATTSAPALVKALKRMAAAELAYALLFTIGILL